MKKIAILASDNMMPDSTDQRSDAFERDEEMGKIVPAFAALGMDAVLVRWRGISERASEFDAILPLLVWDYFEGNEDAFLTEMAKCEQQTKVFNTFDVLKWNSNKSYLDELERSGAPVIETIVVDRVTQTNVTKAFDTLKTDKLVIKPQVGGGAWRQVLHTKGEGFPTKDALPPEGAMIQAFLPSVLEEGEYSFLFFGGQFSHGLVKRPKAGDYRIQSQFGGTEEKYTPTSEERATARSVLDSLDFTPLYARVDLLRGLDGTLKLIELEMIEPYLYLPYADGEAGENKGALKLAQALAKRLDAT
ncbi:MAG: ATP-grasp domain-containing protein [Maricaulaceae bacterium]